jgi:hypothetical protein
VGSERSGPFRITKFNLADGNTLSVTLNTNSNEIVYIESNWGRRISGRFSDIPGLVFGESSPADIAERFGSFGVYFEQRGVISKIDDGFAVILSYPAPKGYLVFMFRVPLRAAKAALTRQIARTAVLDGVILAERSYLWSIWGAEVGAIDAKIHGLLIEPNEKSRLSSRQSRNNIERFVLAEATAAAVNPAFSKVYREGGMIQVRSSIEACYKRARKIMTERAAAYCFMLDILASTLANAAQRRLGFPIDDFHRFESALRRNASLMASMKVSERDRRDLLELWTALIVSDSNR